VYQAGTLSGNPLATAAGLAALGQLDDACYERLSVNAFRLAAGLEQIIREADIAVHVPVVGPLLGLFFTDEVVHDYDEARAAAGNGLYARFFRAMLDRGVAIAPGPYEVLFPSLAHSDDDIARTLEVARAAVADIRGTSGGGT